MPEENTSQPAAQPTTTSQPVQKSQQPSAEQPTTKHKPKTFLWVMCSIILLALIGFVLYTYTGQSVKKSAVPAVTQQTPDEKGTLRIAENIDEDGLDADTKEFQPFIDYLVKKLNTQGITKGIFIGTKTPSQMSQLVRGNKVDIIIDSAFPVYVVSKLAGAEPIADRWKGGAEKYHTAFFVKKDSPIQSLADMKGKMLAFDSTTSTVGYFLPKAQLIKQGYTVTLKNNPTDPCSPTEICYVFVHGNVYKAVADGTVAIGAESELEIDAYFGKEINNYRIIARTPDILRFMVALRGNLDPTLKTSIKNILFSMDGTPEGQTVLKSFADTAKFTPINNTDTAYGVIKDLTDIVEEEIVRQ